MNEDRKEFLSYAGLRHFVENFWKKLNDLFLRKDDPIVKHVTYSEDSSAYVIDSSIVGSEARFDGVQVGADHFHGVDASLEWESENPIRAIAIKELRDDIYSRFAAIRTEMDELWEAIGKNLPIRVHDTELIIDNTHAMLDQIKVFNELLASYPDGADDPEELPSNIFAMDSSVAERLVIDTSPFVIN